MDKKVLGKGLEALIPKKISLSSEREFTYLPLSKIKPGRYQPRQEIEGKEVKELAQSIKEKGFIQPIVVRKKGEEYEIIAGGRRYFAAKLLNLKEIPTLIKNLDDKDTLTLAIIENLQRKDLNPLEEAEAFRRLKEEFSFTQEEIAKFIGKDKTTIANTLRLLKLPEEIKQALKKGLITRSQARTILGVEKKEQQQRIFYQILKGGLSVREIERRVRRVGKRKPADPFVKEIEEKLEKLLGTRVKVFNSKGQRGRVVIEYYNWEDLERICKKLT